MIKAGSKWQSGDHKVFVVIETVTSDDGNTWVHYCNEKLATNGTLLEYSCFQESFLSRFTPLPL